MRANDITRNKAIQSLNEILVNYIQTVKHCTRDEALQILITTITFAALQNKQTKLFCESSEYLIDMLNSEFNNDLENWMAI